MKIGNFNNIKIILALLIASLLTYGVSLKFYHFIWQRNSEFDKEYSYPTPHPAYSASIFSTGPANTRYYDITALFKMVQKAGKSVEEIEEIIRGCETGNPENLQRTYDLCFRVNGERVYGANYEEFKEVFEDYKNALNNYQLKRNNFVFRMSIITTIIVTTLLYLYLKKGLRSKIFILITASCVVYLASANFYKLGYKRVFTYPPIPYYEEGYFNRNRFNQYNLFNEYERLKVIKRHKKAAQECKERAEIMKKQYEQSYYYARYYQGLLEDSKECYQENKQIENLTKEYQSAITNYRKNLSIFSFVMAIITTGLMNVFLYGYLRKTYHDQQSSNIEENELNQLSYSSSPSGSSQVLSFEQWLDQNSALQYFSKEKQTEAYQKYLESMRVNALSFEEWLSQNPALQYFSEQQQHQAYQSYLSTLG